jgi:pyruvate dehydrogenase E1 component alpha subunit
MSLTQERRIEMYRRILKVRYFEETVIAQHKSGQIPGPLHTSVGQEGAIVGACMALRDDDVVVGTHRSHGHPIGKGAELPALMAEVMGRKTGICKGQGGSMHLADFSVGVIGESGIIGAGIPLATGAGLSARVRGTDQVALCFFGDGASNEGTFHESLNMAAIWKLPVIYFCENNLYGATTPVRDVIPVDDIADRAAGYAMPGRIVDGQDAHAVYEVVSQAVQEARSGRGPSLIEAKTYRFGEHAESLIIPVAYRDPAEVDRWRERDPVGICRRKLLDDRVLSDEQARRIEEEVTALVDAALAFARESDFPDPDETFRNLYANPISHRT